MRMIPIVQKWHARCSYCHKDLSTRIYPTWGGIKAAIHIYRNHPDVLEALQRGIVDADELFYTDCPACEEW